jgi:hypothetical protein
LQAAGDCSGEFVDGVHCLSLAAIDNPAVVGLGNATTVIQDGQPVEVDGG